MEKPTIEQTAWVLKHLIDHFNEGGKYRKLIYDRMGYDYEAYQPLYEAGGFALSQAAYELKLMYDVIGRLHKKIEENPETEESKAYQKVIDMFYSELIF
jgi:hypothetical protein